MTETEILRNALKGRGIYYRASESNIYGKVEHTQWYIDAEDETHAEFIEESGTSLVGGEYHLTTLKIKRTPTNPLTASDVIGLLGIER